MKESNPFSWVSPSFINIREGLPPPPGRSRCSSRWPSSSRTTTSVWLRRCTVPSSVAPAHKLVPRSTSWTSMPSSRAKSKPSPTTSKESTQSSPESTHKPHRLGKWDSLKPLPHSACTSLVSLMWRRSRASPSSRATSMHGYVFA